NMYLCEGYNELFNHIGTVSEVVLAPRETKRIMFSLCTKLAPQHGGNGGSSSTLAVAGDSSEEERAHLSETSCLVFSGRLVLQPSFIDDSSSKLPIPEVFVPLQGQVCRSLLRLDVKELHFDDCVPGGSFVKDFTVWNRSEIPLLFKLVSSLATWSENKELIICTDYNSGYVIGDRTLQAAAYGHVRIRLSIKEPNGSYLMSGSRLDFGDCYTGIANSKVILMRNMTDAALHVELTSDRPKEVTFELKLQQNRSRSSRAPRIDDLLSPTNSNGSSLKESLSPDGAKTPVSFSNMDAYGMDSDEEADENEVGELMDFYDEEFQQAKRTSFEENPMGDAEDLDDEFEFDREPRALPQSPLGSPKMRSARATVEQRKKVFRIKGKKSAKVPTRVRDLAYESGVDRYGRLTTLYDEHSDAVDLKGARLTKQTFRVSFRCFLMQGSWQQAQSRVYDRTLGKSLHIRARTCTSMVTVTPSILHLGDCNIGELKSSSCMLTNHSELPTVVKPLVTSKVISTVPNDDMTLGPKQSTELKIEIIPRKTNPNYSRLISIINMKNKSNIPQICVRSSNMDAHHVIYHSLFYKLLTQSKSAFLNFDHVAINSVGIQVFDLENITNAPLHLNIQSSAPSKVRLYCIKLPFGDVATSMKKVLNDGSTDENQHPQEEVVAMVRERVKRLQALFAEKKLVLLSSNKERNLRIPAKSRQRIVAVFNPVSTDSMAAKDMTKTRVEKHKIMITLPPGGNKKAVADGTKFDQNKPVWATSKHPFDTRSSVRELLLKGRVCRSVMNVNQKNINFGRIAASSKSSKRLIVQNMSATPLVYSVEKTGSISSGFLQIKEGEVGVVKAFGTKEICFQFQPTLAGPFEEKLKIINVQDVGNSVSVTIKAKVVKRETFKLLQSGTLQSLCKTDQIKIAVRNTSRKKREYVIQLDPSFTVSTLRPTFYFSVDETPPTIITQAQEKKLDEELEKLEHKLRIAVTKKKSDKIVKLNAKISRVKALLSGEQVPSELSASADSDLEAAGVSGGSSEVGEFDAYDSGNSESEYSESESSSRPRRRRSKPSDKPGVDVKSGLGSSGSSSQSPNMLHFSLEAEATGRIVAYAIFQPLKLDETEEGGNATAFRSQKMKKRQLRRDSTPVVGVGKFLLFEQQNKDVVKELQYNAEVFTRTQAGESAFCRAVGRKLLPPSILPPHPKSIEAHSGLGESSSDVRGKKPQQSDASMPSTAPYDDVLPSLPVPVEADSGDHHRRRLKIEIPDSGQSVRGVNVNVASDQFGISPVTSNLLVPAEESPADTRGWSVMLSLGSPSYKGAAIVEVGWCPVAAFRNVLALSCDVVPRDFLIPDEDGANSEARETSDVRTPLPFQLLLPPDRTVSLHFKWCFASDAGFASSTSFASCVSRSILESISEAAELSAGKIEFVYRSRQSSPLEGTQEVAAPSQAISSLGVAVVKAVHRSLCFETDAIDLGEHQQGTDVRGEVIIHNRYHQALQFLLLAGSRDQTGTSTASASPTLAGGDITFENATGIVEAGSHVTARFTYKGSVPGQHNEQIVLRNLSGDRLDTSVLTLAVRVTRPVYIRIPELDAHTTGQLEVLDLGPCYVTPEMQDTAADSPNVSLRFSKVHKLTLHSQVEETLVLCASSNLKTQCYVYEDVRLHREATHVVLKGKQSTDLYVAIRPRLSGDAIKTGSTRDLVGGIRVQLFGFVAATSGTLESATGEEKSDMLAEFTIKFVGVAGASIARVTPSMIDFGVEHNSGRTQTCKTHEGRFELINMSKALPLGYRLFVTNTTEGYSDDDDSLHISLKHEKGEIPPGETGIIDFRLVAYTNGLFRRRIMVENIHYPGKISFVDVVLFVDSGALRCEVSNSSSADSLSHVQEVSARSDGTPDESSTVQTVHFGLVNVIKLEDELADASSVSGGDGEPASRRYRIYEEHADGLYFEDQLDKDGVPSNSGLRAVEKVLVLTNTTDHSLVVRPLSTLPLTFQWTPANREATAAISPTVIADEKQDELMARSTSADEARKLQTPVLELTPRAQRTSVFYGDSYALAANSSCALSFRFASIAATMPLPVDIIENGKLSSLWGMIGIQSFEGEGEADSQEACTLKLVHISGYYGESRFQIADKRITLGKIGYAIGWKSSAFEVAVKNVSDVESSFVIANLPACIHVCNVRDATRVSFQEGSMDFSTNPHVPSLRMLALDVDKQLRDDDMQHWSAWKLPPRTTCMIEMELILTPGAHEFSLRFFNLHNPQNHEDVSVRAQIISSYAELVVDPESSDYGMSKSEAKGKQVAFLPPVTVPTPQDAPPHRASFWFSLRNVYDEELCVKLSSQARSPFDRTITIAPGDSVDIRVVCHVFAFARLPADTWSTGTSGATSEILDLGHVWLDVSVQNMENAAQRKEVQVKGKLLPGKTFMLSASSLHFFAATTEMPADIPVDRLPQSLKSKAGISRESSQLTLAGASQQTSNLAVHQLRNSSESFWVRNPSTLQVLNFVVDPVSMYQSGLCLVEGSNESEMCAMVESIQAVAVPSSGVVAPGESVKIAVHLEEAPAVIPPSKAHFREGSSNSPTGKTSSLHKMRHNPTWRSNSWDADGLDSAAEASGQNHMFLTVRDADASLDAGVSTEVDVHLVLQQQSSGGDNAKQGGPVLDKTLISAAFEAREKRLTQSRKLYPGPTLETHMEDEVFEQSESAALDNFEEFDISSIRSGAAERTNQLPVLTIRGCTPVEYSSLENTRYVIDVGQHTVRNGGEVEWEITIESLYSAASAADPGLDSVEYRLMLVDKNARSWLQLSRDRGTLDRARSYQSVVLYFLRDVVGVYSSFMVLQNMTNPSDLKVIHVRLE
ncbi:hypothetical protein BBJ28_00019026, partial [Nothophytophthora sp. Chile5]